MVHYAEAAELMKGLPTQIAQYNIGEGKLKENIEKFSFTMRVSNNIHNIACLDEAEFCQEWQEEEKIPIKASPVTVPPPKKEEPKAEPAAKPDAEKAEATGEEKKEEPAEAKPEQNGDKPMEPSAETEAPVEPPKVIEPEQKYEIKMRNKKNFSKLKF